MNMNERDVEKFSKAELIKMLFKQKKSKKVRNHEDFLDNDPFKDEVSQPITYRKSLEDAFQDPLENPQ